MPTPSECPICGAAVPRRAKACPECGADERTGWNETETRYDGLDLPAEAFGRPPPSQRSPGLTLGWGIVALGLLALLVYLAFT